MTTMNSYLKEQEGISHNSMAQISSTPSAPWWSAFAASPSVYGEGCGQVKNLSMEHLITAGQLTSAKQAGLGAERGGDKGNMTQFTIFTDGCKDAGDEQKSQAAMALCPAPPEYRGHFDLGFGQPMICAKYPYMDQCYGLFSTFVPQVSGRVMLPLSMPTDDGPIYVNAKQYHGIMRRRQSRAKSVIEKKVQKSRKPYMHHSRHLHAMRRPRGSGGRFLNTKCSNNEKGGNEVMKASEAELYQQTDSPNSEVLQSKEANGNGSNVSEVTSMYVHGDLERFHLGPTFHPFADMMANQRGGFIPGKWGVAAADSCCTLKV